MEKYKLLTGSQIVAKAASRVDVALPDLGVKDVIPNGSWLEQKQIQSALEARKRLVEVERIDKSGNLSHAEWREVLQLAEVTQQVGGYWQYVGHHVDKQLFLYPEEALYLMESNSLLLKYNEVTVSLQQAYSILLNDKISILQYRVYASLSRLGYKVFRNRESSTIDHSKHNSTSEKVISQESNGTKNYHKVGNYEMNISDVITDEKSETMTEDRDEIDNGKNESKTEDIMEISDEESEIMILSDKSHNDTGNSYKNSLNSQMKNDISEVPKIFKENPVQEHKYLRIFRNCDLKDKQKYFSDISDLAQKRIVTVKTPEKHYLPQNIVINNASYIINLENVKNKPVKSPVSQSRTYSTSDEVNGAHVRRIRSHSPDLSSNNNSQNNTNTPQFSNSRFSTPNPQFRPFNFRRMNHINHLQFRLFFQRPFIPNFHNFIPRFQMYPRMYPIFVNPNNIYSNINTRLINNRKRTRDEAKSHHLAAIKHLAARLRMLILSGNTQEENLESLQRLISTYNVRYKTNIKLSEDLNIIEENITETIELDDDDSSKNKKPRFREDNDYYGENFAKLKQLATKLKDLENKGEASAIHRRAFSNSVKTFNKSYKADVYVNSNYEVTDRRFITLESSSDSDCVVEKQVTEKNKKLWNPFSVLKNVSEAQTSVVEPNTSLNNVNKNLLNGHNKYKEVTLNTFDKYWLPDENDFGRAEVAPLNLMNVRLLDTVKEKFLYEFLKSQTCKYNNWFEVKSTFFHNLDDTTAIFESERRENNTLINSLIKPEDCTDLQSVLKKLSIIKTEKGVANETSLNIDFDVYNRNVQNFKKSIPPKPHFRIICVQEFSEFPSGVDIATLHSKYEDDVIIFAIVGTSSVSYLQINPADLPLYIPSNDVP